MPTDPRTSGWESVSHLNTFSRQDPDKIAHAFLHSTGIQRKYLINFKQHYVYSGFWKPVDADEVKAEILRFLRTLKQKINSGEHVIDFRPRASIIDEVECLIRLTIGETIEEPCWLSDGKPDPWSIAFQNCIYHTEFGEFIEQTPDFFTTHTLPFEHDENAPEPVTTLSFLKQVFEHDNQSRSTIMEWVGYNMTAVTAYEKGLMLIGPPRSGKGTICDAIIGSVVGSKNIVSPSITSLAGRFGAAPMIGKSSATINDVRLSRRTDEAPALEVILGCIGQDNLSLDRKNKDPWEGKLSTRITIAANELPKFFDTSNALAKRMIIIKMTKSFYGQENFKLKEIIKSERQGIANYAIDALINLRGRGHFIQPESGRDLLNTLNELSSPISTFLQECCVIDINAETVCSDLYDAWTSWRESQGYKKHTSTQAFARDLKASEPSIETKPRKINGSVVRYYLGIKLK